MADLYRTGVNVKILDVILKEEAPIIQGTNWTKTWLDWDEIPDLVVKNNPAAYANVKPLADPAQAAKAKLDAWRRANPGKFPEEAWTYLGGKGPIPTPSKQMPARDLRSQPPDDSGTWIDSGNYWTHTIPPFIFAIKPDNRNPATWGPAGGNTSYIPVEQQIAKFRKENPKITDQEIDTKLRELPGTGTVGGKMYTNREIADGIQKAKTMDAWLHREKTDKEEAKKQAKEQREKQKQEREAWKQAQKFKQANGKCPDGWELSDDEKTCERDPDNEPPENPVDKPPVSTTVDPTIPVNGECQAGWKLSADKKKCEKDETPAPVGKVSMIWPAGNKKLLTGKFEARDGKHRGIDIGIPYGSDVVAPEDGTIFERKEEASGAGLYLKLRSTDGQRVHIFMHLSITIRVPQSVVQGKRIAQSGGEKRSYTKKDEDGKDIIGTDGKPVIVPEEEDKRAGNTTGAHLHWGLEVEGKYVNPLDYVDKK